MGFDQARWGIPLVSLMLLVRQNVYLKKDGKGINLSDIEAIDSGEIDRMIRAQKRA